MKTARHSAIRILTTLDREGLPLSQLFEQTIAQDQLRSDDVALVKKICYGVLRQKNSLDSLILKLCTRPKKKIKPFVYQALLTGLYQLYFLDRIPDSAAVNETVKAVASAGLPKSIQGFVNGVLRESIRRRDELLETNKQGDLNHPEWLTERWRAHYGRPAMEQICQVNNLEPPLILRATGKTTSRELVDHFQRNGINARPGRYGPDAVILEQYMGPIPGLPGFEDALFQVQGQAAQLVTHLLGPFPANSRYLDCCAGLGGKTSHLLSLVAPTASVTALEPHPGRHKQLLETIKRTGQAGSVIAKRSTLAEFADGNNQKFNAILIDAPCSGTGVIRKHPDIRWNRSITQLRLYQEQQLALLKTARPLLAPEGILVYATCSIEPEENETVIEQFLESEPTMKLTDCRRLLPAESHQFVTKNSFSPLPSEEMEGFFAARLTSTPESD